jgi:O-antigen/teichoic acid export membrane protein
MGIIQKQAVSSSIIIMIGFALGGLNILIFAPKILTTEQIGLTRIITDVGLTLATFCTLGSMPVIYKFFPFYKGYLPPQKNDLAFITLIACVVGFVLTCSVGYALQPVIVRKYSYRSPLFVQYSYLVYPFCLFMLLYMWMESFSWSLKRTVTSNALKEVLPRVIFAILLALMVFQVISFDTFLWVFACAYLPAVLLLFLSLRRTKEFYFVPHLSPVTQRLKGRMVSFGLFIYGAQFLNLLSRTSDSIIITAKATNGLTDTAVFTIAGYIAALMEIPQRSMMSITVPVLAESWRNKDLGNIQHIYSRSISNLLVIGLGMFALLWLNTANIANWMGKDYQGMESVVLFLGIAKLIDLGTGANAQIIGTSNYWKVDFTTNVIYTILAIPLNYLLISGYGLIGAAYAALISQVLYNAMRYIFLWYKYQLQPYNRKHLLAILITILATGLAYILPRQQSVIADALLRSVVFAVIFAPLIFRSAISTEINALFLKYTTGLYGKFRKK